MPLPIEIGAIVMTGHTRKGTNTVPWQVLVSVAFTSMLNKPVALGVPVTLFVLKVMPVGTVVAVKV